MQDPLYDFDIRSPLTSVASTPPSSASFEEVIINGSKVFSCLAPDCGKTFRYKSEMIRHIAIHLEQRPYVCTHPGCNKTFKRNDALTNHFKVHNKKAAHACPVAGCKSEFSTKSSLRLHLLKHEDQKTFECSYPKCNHTFTTQNQLKQHEKTSCLRLKETKALTVAFSPVYFEPQADPDIMEYAKFTDIAFPEFNSNLEDIRTLEADSDRCNETGTTEVSEISSMGNKSGRNLEDILFSLLTYMTEENQQLKKKLKYSNDILRGSLSEVTQTQEQSHEYYSEQDHEQFPSLHFDQEPVDVDSFFKSPFRFEDDEEKERDFIF